MKIIVSDYDQTFYISDKDIEKNKFMVDKFIKSGNLFIIATGRSYLDFHNKLDVYHFSYNYVILNHGATIIDDKNKIILNIPISNSIISSIVKDLDLEKSVSYFCCSGIDSRVNFKHQDITKINVKYESKDSTMKKVEFLNNKYHDYINAYYVNNNSLEIISKDTNKKEAISYIMKLNDLKEENVYTIGDGYSDIEMIKKFNGYCMKESEKEVKKVATGEYNSVSNMIEDVMQEKI